MVKNPIDLLKIQQKIRAEDYNGIEDLSIDLQLLVNNAKLYYKVGILNVEMFLLFLSAPPIRR